MTNQLADRAHVDRKRVLRNNINSVLIDIFVGRHCEGEDQDPARVERDERHIRRYCSPQEVLEQIEDDILCLHTSGRR